MRVSALAPIEMAQCSLFGDVQRAQRRQRLETAVDFLRCKYGDDVIDRGIKVMHSGLFETEDARRRSHVENPFRGVEV